MRWEGGNWTWAFQEDLTEKVISDQRSTGMWGAGQAVIRERAFQAGNSKCKDPEAEPARPEQMEQREGGKSSKRPATGVQRGVGHTSLAAIGFCSMCHGGGEGVMEGFEQSSDMT